jgi:two-component system, response regulator YesN
MYKVIIVDDEELFRKNLIKKTDWEGYNLKVSGEARDGVEALSLISLVEPDIIICDIKMPVIDGISLLKQLPKARNVKFIILSGYNDFEFTHQAVKYGAFDYVLKPVNEEEIAGVLIRAVESLDSSIAKNNSNLMLNIKLRNKMVESYESLIIHFAESRDITSINRCIDNFYDSLDIEYCPEAYYRLYTEFVILAGKICSMFKLDTRKIIEQFNTQTDFYYSCSQKPLAANKVKDMFSKVVDELICSKNSEGKKIVNEVIEYINVYYNQKLSLEIIAKRYFINPSYFSQLFKSITNENFSTYLINRRISKAKELLSANIFKIYQIANMVGYEDEKHFSQIFKKYVGVSPVDFIR